MNRIRFVWYLLGAWGLVCGWGGSLGRAADSFEAPAVAPQNDLAVKVDAYLNQFERFGFCGFVMIWQDASVLLSRQYGRCGPKTGGDFSLPNSAPSDLLKTAWYGCFSDRRVHLSVFSAGGFSAESLYREIENIGSGKAYKQPPEPVAIDPTILNSYAGTYQTVKGGIIRVTVVDSSRLQLSPRNQAALSLLWGADARGAEGMDHLNQRAAHLAKFLKESDDPTIRSFEVIGTSAREQERSTVVELSYEKGNEYLWMLWSEDRLVGMQRTSHSPAVNYVPRSLTEFRSFRLDGAEPPIVSFRLSGHGGSTLMTLGTAAGEIPARKTE